MERSACRSSFISVNLLEVELTLLGYCRLILEEFWYEASCL